MKRRVVYGVFGGLVLMAGLVSAPQAFTLGDLRGSVVVGRPLDMSVTVTATPEEEISAACFAADVFHADTLQTRTTVTVARQEAVATPTFKVRIQSSVPVDEPVVTVQLRSTCANQFSRRYVLLADFPVVVMPQVEPAPSLPVLPGAGSGAPAPAVPIAKPMAAPVVGVTPAAAALTPSEVTAAAPAVKPVARPKPVVRKKVLPAKPKVSKPAVAAVAPTPAPEPVKPALKLEALNLPAGQPDGLAGAPLALPSPESVLQAKQIETLQEELKALKELASKNNAAMVQMQSQLQKAQNERVSLQLFYVVMALLAMSVAVLLWLLWQRYRDQPGPDAGASILTEMALQQSEFGDSADHGWSADTGQRVRVRSAVTPAPKPEPSRWDNDAKPVAASPAAGKTPTAAATLVQAAPEPTIPASLQDLNHAYTNTRLQDVGDTNFDVIAREDVDLDIDMSSWAGLGESGHVDTHAESVADIRQQAEFFVSLGQTERALFVLKKQIAASPQANPFVYLDLLSLFHSLGYKTDFREYRTAFNRYFNCVLPDFPAYHLEGRDLTAYTDELARLSQVWNRKEVIAYLNACIYRSEQASAQPSFELAAFRDLLLLLAIAEQGVGGAQA